MVLGLDTKNRPKRHKSKTPTICLVEHLKIRKISNLFLGIYHANQNHNTSFRQSVPPNHWLPTLPHYDVISNMYCSEYSPIDYNKNMTNGGET